MSEVFAGKNSSVNTHILSDEELRILKVLEKHWYITNGVHEVRLEGNAKYKYFLMKLAGDSQRLFNLECEIAVIMNDYPNFEPRTLNVLDKVYERYHNLRIEKIVAVVISKDPDVKKKAQDMLRRDPENQVIIPFSYDELNESIDSIKITGRFREFFYNRDLFNFQSPLKKEFYFFGRNELIHSLVDRHENNESSGLFGLRKTGKTSIIFGIQRVLQRRGMPSVFIDCQNPAFHQKQWYKALKYVIDQIKEQNRLQALIKTDEQYTESDASSCFEKDIVLLHKKLNKQNILLIFDEIEHISPDISPSNHWRSGLDFVYFWQTLRSLTQKHTSLFTYLIVGTNPRCTEMARIQDIDNPIFNQIPCQYIPAFSVEQTADMVKTLGYIMGLKFDDIVCAKLTEDFGGHPFLIRSVCSEINRIANKSRPLTIDKGYYSNALRSYRKKYTTYIEMILNVLQQYYHDEYDMLRYLALDDTERFEQFAALSNEYTDHLLGYNVIGGEQGTYTFKIEIIREYLKNKYRFQKQKQTEEERRLEIQERRSSLEIILRTMIRQILLAKYGELEARKIILDIFGGNRKEKFQVLPLKELFNPNKSIIYWEDLRKIIEREWPQFEHIFGKDKQRFSLAMQTINDLRCDAHAKGFSEEEMALFRSQIKRLEEYCEAY